MPKQRRQCSGRCLSVCASVATISWKCLCKFSLHFGKGHVVIGLHATGPLHVVHFLPRSGPGMLHTINHLISWVASSQTLELFERFLVHRYIFVETRSDFNCSQSRPVHFHPILTFCEFVNYRRDDMVCAAGSI